jgi:hypothetical protein
LTSAPCLLFNFFSMVLVWKDFYATLLDGVVKHLENLDVMGLMVLHLGKGREWTFY